MTKDEIDKVMPMYNNYFYKPDALALKHMMKFMGNLSCDFDTFNQTIQQIANERENKRETSGSYPAKLSFMQVERLFFVNKRRNEKLARRSDSVPGYNCSACDDIGMRYAIVCSIDGKLTHVELNKPVESSQYWISGVPCGCSRGDWCNDQIDGDQNTFSRDYRKWIMANSFRIQSEASFALDKIRGIEIDSKAASHLPTMDLYQAVKTARIRKQEFTNA